MDKQSDVPVKLPTLFSFCGILCVASAVKLRCGSGQDATLPHVVTVVISLNDTE